MFMVASFSKYSTLFHMQISPVRHHIMSFQKSIVFLTNTYLKNLKIALVYVLISQLVINWYLFVKIFYQGKILRFQNVIMRCDVTPVIFAYETKLNILQRKQVTKIL